MTIPAEPATRPLSAFAQLVKTPVIFLMMLAFINYVGFAGWSTLFNNFAKEAAGFNGRDIGFAQMVREIPGFLAFTALFWFFYFREQVVAYVSLLVLAGGIVLTGFYPSLTGLLITTFIMSVGFHYFETVNQSLSLQLFPKADAPRLLGKVSGAAAAAQFFTYSLLAILWWSGVQNYIVLFSVIGAICLGLLAFSMVVFPKFDGPVVQHKSIILRKRYWLYYALTFMAGARRQIFTAFAGFLMVERFGFKVPDIALLLLVTSALTTFAAPRLGALVGHWGERRTITIENIVLILVFLGYAFVQDVRIVAALYVIDGVFGVLTIAQRTYIQKIGDPADMAPTAACAFTINHIAAMLILVPFGFLWLKSPSIVFLIGAGIATTSLALSFMIPRSPAPGNETVFSKA